MTCHIVQDWPRALCGFDFSESRREHSYVEALGRRLEMATCRACLRAHHGSELDRVADEGASSQDVTTVCVFCGSRPGVVSWYLREARALGAGLAERGMRIVYGGASIGLMGALANAALGAGGEVVSVVPECLYGPQARHAEVTRMIEAPDLHERKRIMFSMASAFVALPGGIGTFDEVFEVLAWSQLRTGGVDGKPLLLLDAGGFFRPLTALLDHLSVEGFLPRDNPPRVSAFPDAKALLSSLEALRP